MATDYFCVCTDAAGGRRGHSGRGGRGRRGGPPDEHV